VDPAQVRQLLLNLAQNALEATEGSGRPPAVRLRAERRGAAAVLAVEDNGVGIPPGELKRVFDLFYSTRKGGTGLGLAIVDRIARNHGGRVEVASTPGRGTTFSVVLPDAVVAETPAAHAPVPA
jgi:signal transduction histidine kinase